MPPVAQMIIFKNILSEVQSKLRGLRINHLLRIDTLENPHPILQSASALDRLQAGNFNASLPSNEGSNAKKVEQLIDLLRILLQGLIRPEEESLGTITPGTTAGTGTEQSGRIG